MRKLLLMSVMLLGSIALFAQITSQNCYKLTNTLKCKITVCAYISMTCVDDLPVMIPPVCTKEISPGQTEDLCIPNTAPEGCTYNVMEYLISTSTETISINGLNAIEFTEFLSGKHETFTFPMPFTEGECKGYVRLDRKGDEIIIVNDPAYVNPCGKFCFRNETGCYYMSFCVETEDQFVDDPCTPNSPDAIRNPICISLGDGKDYPASGCIDFGINPETGCYYCPIKPRINVCSLGGPNSYCFQVGLDGGTGYAKCYDGEEPFQVVLVLENGVYVLKKIP